MRSGEFDRRLQGMMPKLLAMAIKLTKDKSTAEDVLQSACWKALRGWKQFDPGTNFDAWMCRILYNEFYTTKRPNNQRLIPTDPANMVDWLTARPCQDNAVDAQRVKTAIDKLPPVYREAVRLVCVEEWEYTDVAKATGVSEGTMKSRLWRGRKMVQRALA